VTEVVRDAERLADFVEKASDHVPASSCVFYNTVRPLFEDAKPEYKAFADRLLAEHDRLWEHSVLTAERARDQPYHSRRELLATASELIRRDDFFSGEGDGYWKRRAGEVGDAAAKEEMVERLAEELRREADGHRDERFTLAVQVLELLMPTGFLIPDALAARMLERFDAYDCYELVREVYALGEGERRGAGEGGG
jgi:hypothetical protein